MFGETHVFTRFLHYDDAANLYTLCFPLYLFISADPSAQARGGGEWEKGQWLENAHSGSAFRGFEDAVYGSTSADELDLPWARIVFVSDACRTMPRSRSEAHPITSATDISLATYTPRTISRVQFPTFQMLHPLSADTKFKGSQTCWTIVHANRHWAVSKHPSKVRSFAVRGVRASATHIFTMSHIPSSPHHALCVY